MRVLVTGADGMLGTDLVKALKAAGHRVWAMHRAELEITGAHAVWERVRLLLPDVVVNCAAFTAVDECETQSELAFRVNALGPRNLAVACHEAGAALLHISTEQVFDGTASRPYREWDRAAPINQYGASKLAGEELVRATCPRHWLVRTQWLYGASGNNFVRTIRRLADERKDLAVVHDQIGSPTYTVDLAEALVGLIASPTYGTYHITNSGSCSWYDFARLVLSYLGRTDVNIRPQLTSALNQAAARPLYSVLDNCLWRAEGRPPLRNFASALQAFLGVRPAGVMGVRAE